MARLIHILKAVSATLIFLSIGVALFKGPSRADQRHKTMNQSMETHQANIARTREKIAQSKQKIVGLADKAMLVVREIERLNLQLDALQARQRSFQIQIKRLTRDMTAKDQQRIETAQQIAALTGYAAKRLVAFYKLTRLGVAPLVFSSDTLFDTRQTIFAMERILSSDLRLWNSLYDKKKLLDKLAVTLASQRKQKTMLLAACDKEISDISQKRSKRGVLLERIQKEKALTRAALASLKLSAKELDETVRSLKRKVAVPQAEKRPGPFLAQKGYLPMPAQGDLAGAFGPYNNGGSYNVGGLRNGINIRVPIGSPVKAIWNGQVIYAGWFRGYGNIVIIDHGAHYYSLSAQLEQVFKKVGDQVHPGDTIGTLGDTATHTGPGLYFEIRHHGKPEDPVPWFHK